VSRLSSNILYWNDELYVSSAIDFYCFWLAKPTVYNTVKSLRWIRRSRFIGSLNCHFVANQLHALRDSHAYRFSSFIIDRFRLVAAIQQAFRIIWHNITHCEAKNCTVLTSREAAWCIILVISVCYLSACLPVCLYVYVCLSDDKFRKPWSWKLIFAHEA